MMGVMLDGQDYAKIMYFRADVGKLVACLVLINPILTQGGNDKKYRYRALLSCGRNEKNVNPFPKSIGGQVWCLQPW